MLSKEEFIKYIVDGPQAESTAKTSPEEAESVLPEGFDDFGFDTEDEKASADSGDTSFARNLLIASGFGDPEQIERSEVILSSDAAAKHLPDGVYYWPKSDDRPYQTLLFELEQSGQEVLKTKLFKPVGKQQLLEDALSRFVQHTLLGFERGGEKRTASVRQGQQTETLCIISVQDDRDKENNNTRLVCFGTKNKANDSLETFHIREEAKLWEPQIREDHLAKLYDRHFKKLASDKWQNAFISQEERKLARKLLDTCIDNKATEHEIQAGVVNLLEEIAGSYGLRRKGGKGGRRLKPFDLPKDHDIGSDPEVRKGEQNPFKGMTLRDEKNRLLGYIIYCLDEKQDAEKLRSYLEKNNRFHNVLVIYPNGDHAELELWQGKTVLPGKLLKSGANYSGEGEVVNLLSRFFVVSKAKVKNPVELAEELAYRARYLRRLAIKELEEKKEESPLRQLHASFKETLVHDQTEEEFADAFAQTITYGLLTSRWMGSDKLAQSGDRFTRQNALKYLPSTSNFLRELFETALAVKLDDQRGRLLWLVDDIANLLDRIDVSYVFSEGDKNSDQATDPVIHFYEPFLAAYDNDLRNKRGVYFTPKPVVSYIVRSIHELLQVEFDLPDGLADTTSWGEMLRKNPKLILPNITDILGENQTISPEEPFVQLLDPATGTATFLVEVIDIIYRTLKEKWIKVGLSDEQQLTAWNDYVPQYLLPRLNGFELMMAPYAIAHLKISFKLAQTGFHFSREDRASIFLTNALKPWVKQPQLLGFAALAHEAEAVNRVKRCKRFTVVIGNPPYSGESANKGKWISSLIRDYYYIEGQSLGEANPRWLQDDYVKFIRFSEHLIDQANVGIVGLITNHAYLDNATFRGARYSLISTFERGWFLDLHGNIKKKERHPDGSVDANVFDIQQGVAVCFLTKGGFGQPPSMQHANIFGTRDIKYEILKKTSLQYTKWDSIDPIKPFYLLIPQDLTLFTEYESFEKITDVMPTHSNGVVTARDNMCISWSEEEAWNTVRKFSEMDPEDARQHFKLRKDSRDWKVEMAQSDVNKDGPSRERIVPIYYRPFDIRYTYYTDRSRGFLCMPRGKTMMNMLRGSNLALVTSRMTKGESFHHVQVSKTISEAIVMSPKTSNNGFIFPLYLFPDTQNSNTLFSGSTPKPNIAQSFLQALASKLGRDQSKPFGLPSGITPEDIFHYVYAVFHSPGYQNRYTEFLKVDFPRLPLPLRLELFLGLANLGAELISLHLMEFPKHDKHICSYFGPDNPKVGRVNWFDDTVWLDSATPNKKKSAKPESTGFKSVPENVWNFHVGGYQVCHKWLKDRKGRILTGDEINHYQKIIATIQETIRIQVEIDKVIDQHGGWPDAFVTSVQGESS